MTGLLLAAMLAGPVECTVGRVIDGDTIAARCSIWVQQWVAPEIRIRGIDTPEKGWRAQCPEEAELALRAEAFTRAELPSGTIVYLTEIDDDKYGGRVDAVVTYAGGSLGQRLIDAGLAKPYDGRTKPSWCP